jgi:hypothetical protein
MGWIVGEDASLSSQAVAHYPIPEPVSILVKSGENLSDLLADMITKIMTEAAI